MEVVKVVHTEAADQDTKETKSRKTSKGKVLLVDNSTIHNMALKEFLSVVVKDCVTAESAQEAYEKLGSDEHFDCIILDMYLPDAYGKDVLQKIRTMEGRKKCPLLFILEKPLVKQSKKNSI